MNVEFKDVSAFAGIDAPDPACVWSGIDRLGNAILITQGAFGMPSRRHIWQRRRHEVNGSSPSWEIVADDRGEIAVAGAIWHCFKSAERQSTACAAG